MSDEHKVIETVGASAPLDRFNVIYLDGLKNGTPVYIVRLDDTTAPRLLEIHSSLMHTLGTQPKEIADGIWALAQRLRQAQPMGDFSLLEEKPKEEKKEVQNEQ